MKDRVPLYPGRVKLEPVAGQENIYDMTRADSPQQIGTKLNKANLLTDETVQAIFGALDDSKTPNDAFAALAVAIASGTKIQTGSYVGTGTYGSANPCSLTFDFEPLMVAVCSLNNGLIPLNGCWLNCFLWIEGESSTQIGVTGTSGLCNFDKTNNTLSWYTKYGTDYNQCNGNKTTYKWLAIGSA